MGTDEQDQTDKPEATDENQATEKPEVTDDHRAAAKEMYDTYEEQRPTVSMPGTDGAVSGTAINDWIDDDGNPKYHDTSEDGETAKDEGTVKADRQAEDGEQS